MNIIDLLSEDLIILDLKSKNKDDVLGEMSTLLYKQKIVSNLEGFINDIQAREEQSTTGIGMGVAIPHAKSRYVKKITLLFARSKEGVDYKSLDNLSVNLFFMLAVPQEADNLHINILSKLAKLFLNKSFTKELLHVDSPENVLNIFKEYERQMDANIPNENKILPKTLLDIPKSPKEYYIVAVTACPTGIAHTYMAAEALQKASKELDIKINIKIETNGTNGVDNPLSKEDIQKATGVILAINRNIETDRFKGKQVIKVGASEAIKNAKELILALVDNKGAIFAGNTSSGSFTDSNIASYKDTYKHLMSGVSYMLPFVISGGILIAFAFLFDRLAGVEAGANLGSTTFLAKIFMSIGGQAFALFVPILATFIAFSIANRAGLSAGLVGGALANSGGSGFLGAIIAGFLAGYITLFIIKLLKDTPKSFDGLKNILVLPLLSVLITGALVILLFNSPVKIINDSILAWLNSLGNTNKIVLGLILGTMMAIDMGGPFNKAAYIFGVASLSNGASEVMACIMAAGMTPPLGIAIASSIFKNKFTQEEQEAGKSNYIMGLSFITEGAIPFAASNPLKIIPTLIVGSAVASALSMMFNITLPAPHGGIVVMMLANHILLYILAVLIGSLVTAGLLAMVKKV